MALVPKANQPEADLVMTPEYLARDIVQHFKPQILDTDTVLEPCAGQGSFVKVFEEEDITYAAFDIFPQHPNVVLKDFLEDEFLFYEWIITNPPWSLARAFWKRAYELVDNVVFLITINHLIALKARLRDMREAGFAIKEIYLVDTPAKNWPQSGFQLGAIHVKRGWKGKLNFIGAIK